MTIFQMKTRKNKAYMSNHNERAWIEINLPNLEHNVKVLKKALPEKCDIMAVVKADAYGHGITPIVSCLNRNGIHAYAAATLEEGIQLRRAGIKGDILILGYTPFTKAALLSRYRLSQTVVDAEHAEELSQSGKPLRVHIKVNTGMNRLGEDYNHADVLASIFAYPKLKITGIYTHLCVSDSLDGSDIAFTTRQILNFYELLDQLKEKGIHIPKTHIQSSYGVLNYPELQCDYARLGIALYGVLSSPASVRYPLDLQPVLSLKSRIALIRTVTPGESIGYTRDFTAEHEMRIAVISIGYGDGFPRNLSNIGEVLIRGRRAAIIGRICMDQLMADVTEFPDIQRGDIVTLIGRDGKEEITAEMVASIGGTITNELLCRLGSRLKNNKYSD